jgi:hypothetical protein
MSDISNEGGGFSSPSEPVSSGNGVTNLTLEYLKNTRPWVIFIAVIAIIGACFMVLGGLAALLGGACMGARGGGSSAFRNLDLGGGMYGAASAILGLVYLVAAGLEIPIIVYLFRYANSIKTLLGTRRTADLESALLHQQTYWKYVGILTIVGISLAVVAIFIFMVVGVSAGLSRFR